jgi:hypothetical protein
MLTIMTLYRSIAGIADRDVLFEELEGGLISPAMATP